MGFRGYKDTSLIKQEPQEITGLSTDMVLSQITDREQFLVGNGSVQQRNGRANPLPDLEDAPVSIKVLYVCLNPVHPDPHVKLGRYWLEAGTCRCGHPLSASVLSGLRSRMVEAQAERERKQAPWRAERQAALVADRLLNRNAQEPKRWAPRLAAYPPVQRRLNIV